MAAEVALPPSAPMTLAPTVASAIELRRRDTANCDDDYYYGGTCTSILLSCAESINAADGYVSDMDSSINAICYCNSGAVSYLDCFSSQLVGDGCSQVYTTGFSELILSAESYWYQDFCSSVPSSLLDISFTSSSQAQTTQMTQTTPPSTVNLEFASVTVVHLNESLPPVTHTSTPIFQGTGALLQGACAQTDFTLVDGGNTIYWAAFVGCNSDKPECCPFTAAEIAKIVGAGATTSSSSGSGSLQQAVDDYPAPTNSAQAVLKSCAADYYTISGSCCPSGYWPFTRAVGGQTPCWSSLSTVATPPALTAGLEGEPTNTAELTSAVINIVWAMQYPLSSGGGGSALSTAAVAGIGAAGGIALIALLALTACLLVRRSRRNRQRAQVVSQGLNRPPAAQVATILPLQPAQPLGAKHASIPSTSTTTSPVSLQPHYNGGVSPISNHTNPPSPVGYATPQPPPAAQQHAYGALQQPSYYTPVPGQQQPAAVPQQYAAHPATGQVPQQRNTAYYKAPLSPVQHQPPQQQQQQQYLGHQSQAYPHQQAPAGPGQVSPVESQPRQFASPYAPQPYQ